MSMNIFIKATRPITFKKKNGEQGSNVQCEFFDAWQTPTQVTYEIVRSADPKQAYVDWILQERSRDAEIPEYAEDDIFYEGEPVGVIVYNEGKEHAAKFMSWCNDVEEQGFQVEFEVV